MKLSNAQAQLLAVAVGAAVVLYLINKGASAVAGVVDEVATGFNITSPENWVYRPISAVGSAVAGRDWSLGTQLYDWFGTGRNYDPNAPFIATPVESSAFNGLLNKWRSVNNY